MKKKNLERKKLIKRVLVYGFMTLSSIVITTFVTLFTLGYRFNISDGQLEQYALIQFNSTPSGASIFVDGVDTYLKTPNKLAVKAGEHSVVIKLEGYHDWSKDIDIEAGVLDWLNYALMIPKNLTVEPLLNYESVADSLASPDSKYILIQQRNNLPQFDLVNIGTSDISVESLIISPNIYSNAGIVGEVHDFQIKKWNSSSRYVLVKHIYGSQYEWLVIDTEDVALTKNITSLFDFSVSDIWFVGNGGNNFYVLEGSDIRRLDLSAGTISRPLVSNVVSFNVFDSKIICYVGTDTATGNKVVGLYRDGDDNPYVIKTIASSSDGVVQAALSSYFNEYYLVINYGKDIEVMNGSYPTSSQTASLTLYVDFELNHEVSELSFNGSGRYFIARLGADYSSYDLEYKKLSKATVSGSGDSFSFVWLNDNHIWSDRGGNLVIQEQDGKNAVQLGGVVIGQTVALTSNDKYIYDIAPVSTGGYQLQRILIRLN